MQRLNRFTSWVSSRKGAWLVLITWLAVIGVLTSLAPGSKQFAVNSGEGSIHDDNPSALAKQVMEKHFPSDDGLPALVVFHNPKGLSETDIAQVKAMSAWLSSSEKPLHVSTSLPLHELPEAVVSQLMSENGTTLLYHFSLHKGTDNGDVASSVDDVKAYVVEHKTEDLQVEVTGPAGIAADTISIFRNADLVLLFGTIGLILIILIVIYRSPLLAFIPLIISGLVYMVVDRVIGVFGQRGWIMIDSQALSIMMILLFAVITDYCLFVFSRYREELGKAGNQFDAMKMAMSQVSEPIMFSGSTVLVAMLTLFITIFKPYHQFAGVFSIAIIVILIGGITLIPAVFSLLGRRAFWPFMPKLETIGEVKRGAWSKVASLVVKTTKNHICGTFNRLVGFSFPCEFYSIFFQFDEIIP